MEKIGNSLNKFGETLKNRHETQPKQIRVPEQELAKQVCEWLGDFSEFGLWVRLAKRLGAGEFKNRFDFMVGKGIKSGHYLLKSCKKSY